MRWFDEFSLDKFMRRMGRMNRAFEKQVITEDEYVNQLLVFFVDAKTGKEDLNIIWAQFHVSLRQSVLELFEAVSSPTYTHHPFHYGGGRPLTKEEVLEQVRESTWNLKNWTAALVWHYESSISLQHAPDPSDTVPNMTYENELKIAVQAVRDAAKVCRKVQAALVTAETLEKKDKSPVTVADFASQAVVCKALADHFADDRMVGEEGADDLRGDDATQLRDAVVAHTTEVVGDSATEGAVLQWIDRGGYDPAKDGKQKRYWTLDPIDGTKGFLRGQQYAIALALIEDGKVVLGALGCPNLQHTDGFDGCLFTAVRGEGTKLLAIDGEGVEGTPVAVDEVLAASDAKFCESVESGHSNQGDSATIATILGITADPYRIDSQCKYAAVSRGDASIYLRLPTRADYQEKIWDHGAGSIVVEEAGGTVTDVAGNPLDFSLGRTLANNRGIVATNGRFHDEVVSAVQSVIG